MPLFPSPIATYFALACIFAGFTEARLSGGGSSGGNASASGSSAGSSHHQTDTARFLYGNSCNGNVSGTNGVWYGSNGRSTCDNQCGCGTCCCVSCTQRSQDWNLFCSNGYYNTGFGVSFGDCAYRTIGGLCQVSSTWTWTAGTQSCVQCPPGVYGAPVTGSPPSTTPQLTNASCSGPCSSGYYCPAGSTSSTQIVCPIGKYCPGGVGAPILCPAGTYGATTALPSSGCTGPCTGGYWCADGSTSPTQYICNTASGNVDANAAAAPTWVAGTAAYTFGCRVSYYGSLVRTCSVSTGAWAGATSWCTPCSTSAGNSDANAGSQPVFIAGTATYTFSCAAGYWGSTARTCNASNGAWSGSTSWCAACSPGKQQQQQYE